MCVCLRGVGRVGFSEIPRLGGAKGDLHRKRIPRGRSHGRMLVIDKLRNQGIVYDYRGRYNSDGKQRVACRPIRTKPALMACCVPRAPHRERRENCNSKTAQNDFLQQLYEMFWHASQGNMAHRTRYSIR